MIVEAHIDIRANKNQVWTTIANIVKAQDILSGVEKIEILNQPASGIVGLEWKETRIYFGKPAAIDKQVTDAMENEFYKTRAEMDGFIFLTTLTISGNGDNTWLTSSHETKPQGFMAKVKSLPMIFFKGVLKKAILQDLEDFKSAAEHK